MFSKLTNTHFSILFLLIVALLVVVNCQLTEAETSKENLFAAIDAMPSIVSANATVSQVGDQKGTTGTSEAEDKESLQRKHIQQARQLLEGKTTAEEYTAVLGQVEDQLKIAIEANPENPAGKSELAKVYLIYASLLEMESPERLEYLIKADNEFREIIKDDISRSNIGVQFKILRPSIWVRKQLADLDPKTYPFGAEIKRVRSSVSTLVEKAKRNKIQDIKLWLFLIDSSSEALQFDFAVDIADQGIKIVESREGRTTLAKAKSLTLRRAALNINKFDDFDSYQDRFIYLCEAIRADLIEPSNYQLLLQYIGKENPEPTNDLARKLGLVTPGDAVPIKPEWLHRLSLQVKYAGMVNTLIGFEEFHSGDSEAAIENWRLAQNMELSTRELIAKLIEVIMLSGQDKVDNLETILSEALVIYPEAIRIQMLRGLYYQREKNYPAAIDDFRIVLESKPDEVLLHQKVKACYLQLGKRQSAAAEQKIIDAKVASLPENKRVKMRKMLQKMEDSQPAAVE